MKQEEILQGIELADDLFMNKILHSVIKRYSMVFPEWEVMFLTVPKEPEVRARIIESHIRCLEKMKKDPLV